MVKVPSILVATIFALLMPASGALARAQTATSVTVSVTNPLGVIPSSAVGLNASAYDGNLLDPVVPGLIRDAGVRVMRYPGGSEADAYHWQTNSITPGQGGYAAPANTFDHFMTQVVQPAGAQAMMTVNYGSNAAGTAGGDPQEAAAWVNYANNVQRYGVKYWEVGNEIYGNGYYGAHWETDLHSTAPDSARSGDASLSPTAYGTNSLAFITAMKAKDPSIKVGVVLTAPGNWPDEDVLGNAGTPAAWNDNVLAAACSQIDFVAVHWYPQDPGNESDSNLLHSPQVGIAGRTQSIPAMVARLRAEIDAHCPSDRAGQIQIMITETNSVSYNPGKQTVSTVNALFLANAYMTWLENGVANVDWWQLHNGAVTGTNDASSLYGSTDYGDYGVLSNGSASEPSANTPFPAYYGLQMLSKLGAPGDTMVASTSSSTSVVAHAVKQANGNLAVMLINEDPTNSQNVALSLPGYTPAPNPVIYTYGEGSTGIATTQTHGMPPTSDLTLAPYSLTTIVLTPKPNQR
jgi:alpha-L-arabinofuranosidase